MIKGTLKYLLISILLMMTFRVIADDLKNIGVPYIQNYAKSVYLSGNQNWSIAKDKNGVMYFGNVQGLLSFDGKYWQQYKMPNRQIVRSVATASDGTIYTGCFGEFGYWKIANKRLKYYSLIKLLPKNIKITDEIWKIYVDGNKIIFQSFSSIYIYQNNRVQVIKFTSPFLFLHQVNKRFIAEVLGKGLFELKDNKLIPLPNSGTITPSNILSILPYRNGNLLIGTSKDGLFLYDGKQYLRFNTPANAFSQTFQLNNGIQVLNKYYAFGTILNGLIIIDENGKVIQRINKSSGLQNNTILSLYTDQEQNLWAGLDNGIDRIELNAPYIFTSIKPDNLELYIPASSIKTTFIWAPIKVFSTVHG